MAKNKKNAGKMPEKRPKKAAAPEPELQPEQETTQSGPTIPDSADAAPAGEKKEKSAGTAEKKTAPSTKKPEKAPKKTASAPVVKKAGKSAAPQKIVRRVPSDRDPFAKLYNNLTFAGLSMLVLLYMELVVRIAVAGEIGARFFVYASFFAFSAGALCSVLCTLFSDRANYFVTLGLLIFFTLYYGTQMIYVLFFGDFFYWSLLTMAGQITQFWRETLEKIGANLVPIILLILPAVFYAIFGAMHKPRRFSWGVRIGSLVLSAVLFFAGVSFVRIHNEDFDDNYYYAEGFTATESGSRFGIMTTLRLDTQYLLFGKPAGPVTPIEDDPTLPDLPTQPVSPEESTEEPPPETQPIIIVTDPDDDKIYVEIDGVKYELITDPDGKMWINYRNSDGTTELRQVVKDENGNYILYIPPKPIDTSPNVMDIDWDKLIAEAPNDDVKNAHLFFSKREPTNKNAYTGLFKGKNMIFITVEGWAQPCIDPVLTPTLYKMQTEGFVFDNYYCSMWGGSTATGEYANITGNFYKSTSCLTNDANCKTYQKFTLANMLNQIGYTSLGFHNHTYNYYNRDKSHVNFGYQWFGKGNWDVTFTDYWPESDRELGANILPSIPTDGTPFNLYLMTVSGHAHQTRLGNAMAKKHYIDVLNAGLAERKYHSAISESTLYYIASEYEVELMVKVLVDYLDQKGLLNDTVFVLAPDHIPYEIESDNALNEKILGDLYGLPAEGVYTNPETYREALIIWCADMKKPVEVKKVCSAIDILPTLLNLYGLEYDSRLIIGHDILSDTPGFVPLNMFNAAGKGSSDNYVIDIGFYSSVKKTLTLNAGVELDAATTAQYKTYYTSLLKKYNTYSPFILDHDYYSIVFPNEKKN